MLRRKTTRTITTRDAGLKGYVIFISEDNLHFYCVLPTDIIGCSGPNNSLILQYFTTFERTFSEISVVLLVFLLWNTLKMVTGMT